MLLILCGAALLRIALFSELYLRYVKEGLRPYLIVSGMVLIALGVVGMLSRAHSEHDQDHDGPEGHEHYEHAGHEQHEHVGGGQHEHSGRGQVGQTGGGLVGREHASHDSTRHDHTGHDHIRNPRIAWLLTAPALALLLFPPPALGSYSAGREEARTAAQGAGTFPKLPAGDPLDLTLGAFASRAEWDTGASLKDRTVRLTGFVTRGDNGTWYIARLLVACCAADVQALKVEIRGADGPAPDEWVTVTGTWRRTGEPGSDAARPVLDASSVERVKAPSDPYEKR
ncbi:TIGR03943 family protein [Streptomyces sp. NPDC050704]|uniref:TIGR03943 family putative permease subunit n=1 Tax=Streptomyces sp. NPDC050704 TaxID=3157219 RepID=UPI003432AFF0